jgi:hypothetical protein
VITPAHRGTRLGSGHHRAWAVILADKPMMVWVRRVAGEVYCHADEMTELAEHAAAERVAHDAPESPKCSWPQCDCLPPPCHAWVPSQRDHAGRTPPSDEEKPMSFETGKSAGRGGGVTPRYCAGSFTTRLLPLSAT